jgi:hypothetical protein
MSNHHTTEDDNRRCDALAHHNRRCRLIASQLRGGRQVCFYHFKIRKIRYARGDRVGTYREMMARALGDVTEEPTPEPTP